MQDYIKAICNTETSHERILVDAMFNDEVEVIVEEEPDNHANDLVNCWEQEL